MIAQFSDFCAAIYFSPFGAKLNKKIKKKKINWRPSVLLDEHFSIFRLAHTFS